MDLATFLAGATACTGLPGYEQPVGQYIKAAFEPLADDVYIDHMENVITRIGNTGPRIMVSAHQDEIGLVVTDIEKDGCLRIACTGGVDPRILPGMEVSVLGKNERLYGVIGAKPPHLQTAGDKKKALKMTDLYVDLGYTEEIVRAKVRVGDQIVMLAPPLELAGGRMASKTMDDRAGVAAMLECANHLSRMRVNAQVFLVASTQEEVGMRGAGTAAHELDPDLAIAIDVTHGEGPDTPKFGAFPLDKVAIAAGPNIHPMLLDKIQATAKKYHIDYVIDVCPGNTGTDAWNIQVRRSGIPCLLISIPLRYMHTTVETLSLDTVRETGRLLAAFIDEIQREWEDLTWY